MRTLPDRTQFRAMARRAMNEAGTDRSVGESPTPLIPIWRELLFDTETAVTAYGKLATPPFGFLLESVQGGEQWARYSFVGTRPASAWMLKDGAVSLWTPARGWFRIEVKDPLADLDRRLRSHMPVPVPGLPRFWGGAVGYFSYDIVRHIERLPKAPLDRNGLPDGIFLFTDVVLALDNLRGTAMVIAPAAVTPGTDEARLNVLYRDALARIDSALSSLSSGTAPGPLSLDADGTGTFSPFTSSMTREEYEAGVDRIRNYILAGDAFQVVLSQRLGFKLKARPFDVYRALRSMNPSPYLYFLELDGVSLVGSSPEVLVRLEDQVVTVRPIAGTRPRGSTPAQERALSSELQGDAKELSEHRMLVDLGRNDVGRVAEYGSVSVPDLMVIERYSHVMHLVSQVEGRVLPELGAIDVFKACFPAGTVSGAPKVRAMEIIDEIEPIRRGPYAVAVGHFAYDGRDRDTAISVRTLVAEGSEAWVQAGAGIVADSVPAHEYRETLDKARALMRAVAMVTSVE